MATTVSRIVGINEGLRRETAGEVVPLLGVSVVMVEVLSRACV